jgi:hypothetical protein
VYLHLCLPRYILTSHHRQHVFRDLMAYSCTFEHCDSGLFESRIAWKNHELAEHRRDWQCPSCRRAFETKDSVVRHLLAEHPATEDKLVHALVTAASPQHTSATDSDCPFCDDYHASRNLIHPQSVSVQHEQAPYDFRVSIDVHQRHLSRHMEQLALFAVPPTDDGDDDDADDDDDDEASEDDMDPNVDEADDYDDEDDNDDDDVVEHASQEAEDSTDLARHMDALKAEHSSTTRHGYNMNLDPNAFQRREHHTPVPIVNVYNDIYQDAALRGDSHSPPIAPIPPYAPPQAPQYAPQDMPQQIPQQMAQYAPNPPGRPNDLETVDRRGDEDVIVEVIEEHSSVSVAPPTRRKSN